MLERSVSRHARRAPSIALGPLRIRSVSRSSALWQTLATRFAASLGDSERGRVLRHMQSPNRGPPEPPEPSSGSPKAMTDRRSRRCAPDGYRLTVPMSVSRPSESSSGSGLTSISPGPRAHLVRWRATARAVTPHRASRIALLACLRQLAGPRPWRRPC